LFVVLANAEKFRRRLSISREIPMLIELGWQFFVFIACQYAMHADRDIVNVRPMPVLLYLYEWTYRHRFFNNLVRVSL